MKIIITEDQNILLRRYEQIKNEVYNVMDGKDPCWYQAYENFDRFLRSTLSDAINEVLYNNHNMTVEPRIWTNFRNELMYELGDEIKDYYNKFIEKECPQNENNNN